MPLKWQSLFHVFLLYKVNHKILNKKYLSCWDCLGLYKIPLILIISKIPVKVDRSRATNPK